MGVVGSIHLFCFDLLLRASGEWKPPARFIAPAAWRSGVLIRLIRLVWVWFAGEQRIDPMRKSWLVGSEQSGSGV